MYDGTLTHVSVCLTDSNCVYMGSTFHCMYGTCTEKNFSIPLTTRDLASPTTTND